MMQGTLYNDSGEVVANEQIFGFGLGTYYNAGKTRLLTSIDRDALKSVNVDDVIQQLKYTGQYNQNQLDDIRKTWNSLITPDLTDQSVSQKIDIESNNYMSVNNVLHGGPQNTTAGLSAKIDTPHEFQTAQIDNTAIRVVEMMRKINGAISSKDLDSAYSKADISDLGRGGMACYIKQYPRPKVGTYIVKDLWGEWGMGQKE